ncbi:MAG: hypothetical protein HOE11_03880 [Candidatus Diapherotrites archaeon]|jgi:hypothetical protein|nr:hypothetical protein [Candidatus Diapherotrites archaeon]MBT4597238.1 hypothetical protein [Candidatus Diapherotrites archaeon]
MKLRHQKKQVKQMMQSNSLAKNYSQRQMSGFVSKLSKKGRAFLLKVYLKKGEESKDHFAIPQHAEDLSQHVCAANFDDWHNQEKQKKKQKS